MSTFKQNLLIIFLIYIFLKYCFPALSPFIFSFILAKIISRFEKSASILIYIFILIFFTVILLTLIIFFYSHIKNIYFELPQIITVIIEYLNSSQLWIDQLHDPLISLLQNLFPLISSALILLPKAFSYLCFTLFLTFFFLLDVHAPGRLLFNLSPLYFEKAQIIQTLLFQVFTSMLISSFKLFLITWAECLIGFIALGIDHAFLFSLLTASFDSMPLAGVGLILLPYSIYLFIIQSEKAIWIMILYLIITLIRFFIEPKILSSQLNIPILLHLFMMFICAFLFGWIGFLYSPLLCVLILVWYKEKQKESE